MFSLPPKRPLWNSLEHHHPAGTHELVYVEVETNLIVIQHLLGTYSTVTCTNCWLES